MLSKVLLIGKKTRRPFGHLRTKIVIVGSCERLKNIIFVLNYLTILVYTKIHGHFSE